MVATWRRRCFSSPAHPDAYQIWGDETLGAGGEGVRIATETARLSQQAIDDLSRTGQTAVAVQQIRDAGVPVAGVPDDE